MQKEEPQCRTCETIKQFTLWGTPGVKRDGLDAIAEADEYLKPRKRKAKLFTGSR